MINMISRVEQSDNPAEPSSWVSRSAKLLLLLITLYGAKDVYSGLRETSLRDSYYFVSQDEKLSAYLDNLLNDIDNLTTRFGSNKDVNFSRVVGYHPQAVSQIVYRLNNDSSLSDKDKEALLKSLQHLGIISYY